MTRTLVMARLVLFASGALLLLLGLIIWTGSGDALVPIHAAAGSLLVISLWTIAVISARNGFPTRIVAVIVIWSLAVVAFGLTQDRLVEGDWHWTIQVLHLVASMSLVAIGQRLTTALGRRQKVLAAAQ